VNWQASCVGGASGWQVPRHIGPGAQRLLDRLTDVPACVYDAAWTMLTCNVSWAALLGDPAALRGRDRNRVWRHFTGQSSRDVESPISLEFLTRYPTPAAAAHLGEKRMAAAATWLYCPVVVAGGRRTSATVATAAADETTLSARKRLS